MFSDSALSRASATRRRCSSVRAAAEVSMRSCVWSVMVLSSKCVIRVIITHLEWLEIGLFQVVCLWRKLEVNPVQFPVRLTELCVYVSEHKHPHAAPQRHTPPVDEGNAHQLPVDLYGTLVDSDYARLSGAYVGPYFKPCLGTLKKCRLQVIYPWAGGEALATLNWMQFVALAVVAPFRRNNTSRGVGVQ